MDRNSVIGIILIVAILFGYTLWTMPTEEERAALQRRADSLATVEAEKHARIADESLKADSVNAIAASSPIDTAISPEDRALVDSLRHAGLSKRFGLFAPASEGVAEEVAIANDRLQVSFSTKGARPTVMVLKEYRTYAQSPLLLADPDSGRYAFTFRADQGDISTEDLYFRVEKIDEDAVRFIAPTSSAGKELRITYRLDSASYFLHTDLAFEGMRDLVDPAFFQFNWEIAGRSNEKHQPSEAQKCGIYYKYFTDDRDYIGETKAEEEKLIGRTNWVAFKQDFFTVAMVSDDGFSSNGSRIAVRPIESHAPSGNESRAAHTKHYAATLFFEKGKDADPAVSMRYYLGPNHFGTLRRTEIADFQKIIDLGWGIFGWMNQWLVIPIFNWLDGWGWNYGIIILVLTIVIKLLLMPLTYKNLVASAKMRVLKPEMDAINEKHKDGDAMKKQSATMDLYRKAGVNPASGCVPMLIQLPVLYAMFRFFPASIELRQEKFLWADDLSSYDSIFEWSQYIPLLSDSYGNHISLFTLLMAASTIVYSVINQKQMPSQQNMPGMKLMIYLFPIMMLFFLNNFSAGLSYYYLLANLISIAQMTVLKSWFVDEGKIRAQLELNMRTPKKKSKWQQRLEDLQKQQQQQRRK
ncbi:MAG: membrane protein insertase YidC [Flavobacteriales bacterium]|nr:membrane protein insertase YidC [Flavobacteriales bacterium]